MPQTKNKKQGLGSSLKYTASLAIVMIADIFNHKLENISQHISNIIKALF